MDAFAYKPLTISVQTARELREDFEYFNIPVEEPLRKAFEKFLANPSPQTQYEMKYRVVEAIAANSKLYPFTDEVFKSALAESCRVFTEMTAERKHFGIS